MSIHTTLFKMADEQLLSKQNSAPNGCIVAAVNATGTNNQQNHNDAGKLKNCLNGDVSGSNSINRTNGIANNKIHQHEFNTNMNETPPCEVPDGGTRAWCVMISAFFCNSIIFGIINTYGIVYIKIHQYLEESGDPEAASKACKYFFFSILFIEFYRVITIPGISRIFSYFRNKENLPHFTNFWNRMESFEF